MRKIIPLLAAIIILGACSAKKSSKFPRAGTEKILAAYIHPDTVYKQKLVDILYRIIKYDSVSNNGVVVKFDTIWMRPVITVKKDSTGKEYSSIDGYTEIRKDSVNWRVENISLDSLVKKK